jgi:cell division protein FtsW (lipid II flippase)
MVPMAVVSALVLPRLMRLDALMVALMNFLCGVSVVILYTVAPDRGAKQAAFYAVGMAVMLAMSAVVSRLKKWRGLTGVAMVLGVAALILPLAFGEWNYGAKNWVSLPVIGSFQPSEFVKLSLVLVLAYSFSTHRTFWQMMPRMA